MLPGALWNSHDMFIYAIGRNQAPVHADVRPARYFPFRVATGWRVNDESLPLLKRGSISEGVRSEDMKDANSSRGGLIACPIRAAG